MLGSGSGEVARCTVAAGAEACSTATTLVGAPLTVLGGSVGLA